MNKELKARISDPIKIEKQLIQLGAVFTHQDLQRYVYFNQPEGKVLKLAERNGKTYKTVIERRGNKFTIVSDNKIAEPAVLEAELAEKYGIKTTLINCCKFFSLNDETISINDIDGVGDFLIIEGEEPSTELLKKLGIDEEAIVTVSFDNL